MARQNLKRGRKNRASIIHAIGSGTARQKGDPTPQAIMNLLARSARNRAAARAFFTDGNSRDERELRRRIRAVERSEAELLNALRAVSPEPDLN